MANPDLVASMVRAAKSRLDLNRSVSCKIRIHKDIDETIRWVQIVENAGVDFITVHGRSRSQRSSTPPDYDAIRTIKSNIGVPVLANGDAYKRSDVKKIVAMTGADGVMAARGMLENPALFAGHDSTPVECVHMFLEKAAHYTIPFPLVLHHFSEMTVRMPGMTKKARKVLMECRDLVDLIDYAEDKWRI
jgi:tRNA-dihydrouridine synthase 4